MESTKVLVILNANTCSLTTWLNQINYKTKKNRSNFFEQHQCLRRIYVAIMEHLHPSSRGKICSTLRWPDWHPTALTWPSSTCKHPAQAVTRHLLNVKTGVRHLGSTLLSGGRKNKNTNLFSNLEQNYFLTSAILNASFLLSSRFKKKCVCHA